MTTEQPYTPSEARVCIDYCNAVVARRKADPSIGMAEADAEFDRFIETVKRDAAREALDRLEADTAQVIRTMRERGEQGWARYAIANDILDSHRTRFYPEETP